ncbi:MAG TPA: twin-arginine translocase TatA/TatE family subunit [Candidatus Limnocylindria bacterium]|jgi:sec-independent protein translocase protein TatA|nr:twin-arginine translocase TatA/TatE family subunit [Candidatus Limnocylindria bacterium]
MNSGVFNSGMLALFQSSEIMWIAIVVLVLFGAKKVPDLMKGVGQGIREFKKAAKDVTDIHD